MLNELIPKTNDQKGFAAPLRYMYLRTSELLLCPFITSPIDAHTKINL